MFPKNKNRVHPRAMCALDPIAWSAKLLEVIDYVKINKRLPKALKSSEIVGAYAITACCCAPCCLWSTLWRVIACPAQCLCQGPAFMCGNNGCTTLSDLAISATCSQINALYKMPELSCYDYSKFTREEAQALHTAIKAALTLYDDFEWNPARLAALSKQEREQLSKKRYLQYQVMDNCLRPIVQLAGGPLVVGKFEYLTPEQLPKLFQTTLADLLQHL